MIKAFTLNYKTVVLRAVCKAVFSKRYLAVVKIEKAAYLQLLYIAAVVYKVL